MAPSHVSSLVGIGLLLASIPQAPVLVNAKPVAHWGWGSGWPSFSSGQEGQGGYPSNYDQGSGGSSYGSQGEGQPSYSSPQGQYPEQGEEQPSYSPQQGYPQQEYGHHHGYGHHHKYSQSRQQYSQEQPQGQSKQEYGQGQPQPKNEQTQQQPQQQYGQGQPQEQTQEAPQQQPYQQPQEQAPQQQPKQKYDQGRSSPDQKESPEKPAPQESKPESGAKNSTDSTSGGGGGGGGGTGANSDWQKGILDQTNQWRSKYGAEPVVYDQALEDFGAAQAASCQFQHTKEQGKENPNGENLAEGTDDPKAIMDMFGNEASSYQPGNAMSAGHFTQMVWKATKKIGCGKKDCPNGPLVFCEYYPPGNSLDSATCEQNVGK